MDQAAKLKRDYPWIQTPLIVGAPMRLIALAELAVEISKAGGIGFIGAGTDVSDLESHLQKAQSLLSSTSLPTVDNTLPIGVGFINWGADMTIAIDLIARYKPAAVWFFAASSLSSLAEWTSKTRTASPSTKIWIQTGSVQEALSATTHAKPDVLVLQGTDAGGHGLSRGASLISLVPEVHDALSHLHNQSGNEALSPTLIAAGGISTPSAAAAALLLGTSGVALGTLFLATPEANIAPGYQREILRASDGGQNTVRTSVYDTLRGTTGWPATHNARGVVNRSYEDALQGVDEGENKRLYEEAVTKGDEGWGVEGRMTTYAGSGVGMVKRVRAAGEVVREMREGVVGVFRGVGGML